MVIPGRDLLRAWMQDHGFQVFAAVEVPDLLAELSWQVQDLRDAAHPGGARREHWSEHARLLGASNDRRQEGSDTR